MNKLLLLSAFLVIIQSGCNKIEDVKVPNGPFPFMNETNAIPKSSRNIMEGVYSVDGNTIFGMEVVLKWTKNTLLVACENGRYFVLEVGILDSLVVLQGYWRYALNDETGAALFYISRNEGGSSIVTGQTSTKEIIIRGAYGNQNGIPDIPIVFSFKRPFSEKVKTSDFYILAHRSGGRTSDRLPFSENSIEMIRFTEKFGSTGIEIDIRISQDGIPFLYHDSDVNIRLTQKGPLQGDISTYTWQQLSSFVRLIHGEKIPSLEDALNFVIDSTELRFVYLDIKGGSATVDKVIPIQKKMIEKASHSGRAIIIVLGIPDDDILNHFISIQGHDSIPSLCELDPQNVRTANSKVWAPRWTLGTQNELVDQMHSEGRLVISWTVDLTNYVKEFINEGHFDGLLTNHPSIVAYYHYIQ